MRPHIMVTLARGVQPSGRVPHWRDILRDKSLSTGELQPDVDRILRRHGVEVWVTREHKPQGASFSVDEIASGLDRIYRLVLRLDSRIPAGLIEDIRLLPVVEKARAGEIGTALLPRLQAAALSAVTDRRSRDAIGLEETHRLTRGDPEIIVAILDTGVDLDHPELADALEPGFDFVDVIDGAGRFIGDFLGADELAEDEVGHGTHVAGIVGGKGLAMPDGIAPGCRLLPVRVLGALVRGRKRIGAGLIDNIDAGIKFAIDRGARVINMSLGVLPSERELPHEEVVEYARRKGVSIVAASGNDGSDLRRYYPGALPYTTTVGAIDEEGQVAAFSTYGDQVDFVAPGTNIYSSSLKGGYAFSTGTSHAAPFVCGAVALLQSYALRTAGRVLTDAEVKYVLKNTADRSDTRLRSRRAGFGQINLPDALRLLEHKLTNDGERRWQSHTKVSPKTSRRIRTRPALTLR